MTTSRLILCEKSNHWAAAVRISLAGQPPAIIETRSLFQAEAALADSPASIVAIETTSATLDASLTFIDRTGRQFSRARFVGLVASDAIAAAPLLREAGAIDVLVSVLDANRLARIARRQFALVPTVGPPTIREFVAERLPWSTYATQS
jgi:hypothetical protein